MRFTDHVYRGKTLSTPDPRGVTLQKTIELIKDKSFFSSSHYSASIVYRFTDYNRFYVLCHVQYRHNESSLPVRCHQSVVTETTVWLAGRFNDNCSFS